MYDDIKKQLATLEAERDKSRAALNKEHEELKIQLADLEHLQKEAVNAGKREAYLKHEGPKSYIKSRLAVLERNITALDAGTGETGPAAKAVKAITELQIETLDSALVKLKALLTELKSVKTEACKQISAGDTLKEHIFLDIIKAPEPGPGGAPRRTIDGSIMLKRPHRLAGDFEHRAEILIRDSLNF